MNPEILALIEAGEERQLERYLQAHPLAENDRYRYAVVAAIRNNNTFKAFYDWRNRRDFEMECLHHPNDVRQIANANNRILIDELFNVSMTQDNWPIINLLLRYNPDISLAIVGAAHTGNLELLGFFLPHARRKFDQLSKAADAAYDNDQVDAFNMILAALSQDQINGYFVHCCEFDDVNRLRILYPLITDVDRILRRGMEVAISFRVNGVIDYLSDKKDWDWTELSIYAANHSTPDIVLVLTEHDDVDIDLVINSVRMKRDEAIQQMIRHANQQRPGQINDDQYQVRTYNELLEVLEVLERHFQ